MSLMEWLDSICLMVDFFFLICFSIVIKTYNVNNNNNNNSKNNKLVLTNISSESIETN